MMSLLRTFSYPLKESLIIYGNNQRQKNRFKFNKKLFKPNKKTLIVSIC